MTNASEVLVRQSELEPGRAIKMGTFAPRRLNHLRSLEAESIHILREAAAEFARPVMLYSIGKDSSVMLRLAQKAFFRARFLSLVLTTTPPNNFRKWSSLRPRSGRRIVPKLV